MDLSHIGAGAGFVKRLMPQAGASAAAAICYARRPRTEGYAAMWKPIAVMVSPLALTLMMSSAQASKNVPLPCGDYDGVPSHNDCWKVSDKKKEKCQIWIDAGNGTDDAARKEKYKKGYFDCVDWPGKYKSPPKVPPEAPADESAPPQ
jgi:hypothetical protein